MKLDNKIRNIQIIKTVVVISGIILIVAGIVMIYMDIKSEGSISIKTPLLEGKIRATYLGLLVIFLGVILEIFAIVKTYPFSSKSKVIEGPDFKVIEQEETGMSHPLNERDTKK